MHRRMCENNNCTQHLCLMDCSLHSTSCTACTLRTLDAIVRGENYGSVWRWDFFLEVSRGLGHSSMPKVEFQWRLTFYPRRLARRRRLSVPKVVFRPDGRTVSPTYQSQSKEENLINYGSIQILKFCHNIFKEEDICRYLM